MPAGDASIGHRMAPRERRQGPADRRSRASPCSPDAAASGSWRAACSIAATAWSGLSNVVADAADAVAVWRSLILLSAQTFPRLPLVGYEFGRRARAPPSTPASRSAIRSGSGFRAQPMSCGRDHQAADQSDVGLEGVGQRDPLFTFLVPEIHQQDTGNDREQDEAERGPRGEDSEHECQARADLEGGAGKKDGAREGHAPCRHGERQDGHDHQVA